MVSNKRGWLRIVEAGIAILIIFGVLLVITENRQTRLTEQDIYNMVPPLLEEISKNNTLRELIINDQQEAQAQIEGFLSLRIAQPNIKYAVKICPPEDVCGLDEYPKDISGDIYASERLISSTLTTYAPKKVKIFLWRTK